MARQKQAGKAGEGGLVVGRLSMTRHGYGFVEAPEGDYFVPARDVNGAMHGDTVAIRPETHREKQGRAGAVVRVTERANTTVVGRFDRHGAIGIVTPADRRVRTEVFVAANGVGDATSGDIVVAHLTGYPSRTHPAQGYIEEIVGRDGDPDIQIEITIREHGLRTEFPEAAEKEARAIRLDVADALAREPDRIDIRERFTFTIDPVDARDFDDAISIERTEDGRVRLVAFALEVIGKSKHVIRATQVPEVLRLVGLEDKVDSYPDELSGGEQQRVSIARAFVNRPPLLLCDEPTGNLDPQTSLGIMKPLERINNTGTTVLIADTRLPSWSTTCVAE